MKPCKHEYGKWSEAFNPDNPFNLKRQSRKCKSCGKIVVRRIWWSDWCIAQTINEALREEKTCGTR